MTDGRLARESLEVVASEEPPARLGRAEVEALTEEIVGARLARTNVEALIEEVVAARLSRGSLEMLVVETEPEPEPACPPPSNDNWANARVLVGNSGTVHGNNTCATLEPEEPSVSCSGDGGPN